LQQSLQAAVTSEKSARDALDTAAAQIEEQKRLTRNSDSVIAFLNKQLNEQSIGSSTAASALGPPGVFRPSGATTLANIRSRLPLSRVATNTPPPSSTVQYKAAPVLAGLDAAYLEAHVELCGEKTRSFIN
jgi:hypothetical protein